MARTLRDEAKQVIASPQPQFRRPVAMASSVVSDEVRAQIHGVIETPFHHLTEALANPERWCAVLILHINNKACRVTSGSDGAPRVALKVARKYDQPVEDAYDLDFAYHVIERTHDLLSVQLDAPSGPMGTSDYSIRLDATPLDTRTALRLSYAYRQGAMTAAAMDLYLSTVGRGKVGFTTVENASAGDAQFIGGVRGLMERNLMRYFLAVDAAATHPPGSGPDVFGRRLRLWFDSTEAYPRQLHEVDRATYLELKRGLAPRS
jgi:hypothetical protein